MAIRFLVFINSNRRPGTCSRPEVVALPDWIRRRHTHEILLDCFVGTIGLCGALARAGCSWCTTSSNYDIACPTQDESPNGGYSPEVDYLPSTDSARRPVDYRARQTGRGHL